MDGSRRQCVCSAARKGRERDVEQTFYSDEFGVTVTNARLVVGSQVFAMGQVSSVRIAVADWFRLAWVIPLALSSFCLWRGVRSGVAFTLLVGVALALAGVIAYRNREYYVVVATSSGETRALATTNAARAQNVATAISQALVTRG
jgi:hypothetical protein